MQGGRPGWEPDARIGPVGPPGGLPARLCIVTARVRLRPPVPAVDTRDSPRPTPALPAFDPAQLSFGDVAAVPQLRVEQKGTGSGADEMSAVMHREPPVCGESSYDYLPDAGPSWSVRIVQESEAAPSTPRGLVSRPGAVAQRAAASGSRLSATSRPPVAPRPASLTPATLAAMPSRPVPPRTSPLPAAMIAPMRPTPVAMPSLSLDPLKRATELSPTDADAAIIYAQALDRHGNAAAALGALDECLANGGDDVRLICARAFLLGSRLRYDLAEQELKRAAKIRADDPDVQLQTGVLAGRRARWRDAVEPLQKAVAQRADDPLAHFYLGEALNHVDQLPAALSAYEHAARLDPSNWRAFKGVGIVLDRLGRPTDAAVAYRRMRENQGR